MKDLNTTPTTAPAKEPEQSGGRMMNELTRTLNPINMDEKVIRLAKAGELDELVKMVSSNFSEYIKNTDHLEGYESRVSSPEQLRPELAQLMQEENWGEIRNRMFGCCFERLPSALSMAILRNEAGERTAFENHWCGEAA